MILTSNFKTAGHLPKDIAISQGVPRGWSGRRYKPLAPSWALVKLGRGPEEFIRCYQSEILDKLDPVQVVKDMGGDNFIMLCWEAPGEFCHRRVVASWLWNHTRILAEEFMPNLRCHADWLREMEENWRSSPS
jgi:hypothetical protein